MFSVIHTKEDLKIFIDGAIHFSLDETFSDSNNTDLVPFFSVKCINIPFDSIQHDEGGNYFSLFLEAIYYFNKKISFLIQTMHFKLPMKWRV